MTFVTVKDKYEVVIPAKIRRQLGINPGDRLDARIERGHLTYVPKTGDDKVIPAKPAERRDYFKRLRDEAPSWLKETWKSSKHNGTDKLTMRQIDREIAVVRRKRASNKSKKSE